jgi:hypothetical protein
MGKAFEKLDTLNEEEDVEKKEYNDEEEGQEETPMSVIKEALARVTLDEEFGGDDPITEKLAIYTLAHRNYL